jgi:hypothetical protein
MPSQTEIQCECAFTYMNARSRQNLSDAATAAMNRARSGRRKGGALDNGIGMALSRRTTVTCMGGVSDPLRAGRGAKKGAARWGSLTPRLSLCSAATAAPAGDRRHSEATNWQEDRASIIVQRTMRAVYSTTVRESARGTVLPSFGSPTLFPFSCPGPGNQGGRRRQCGNPADGV